MTEIALSFFLNNFNIPKYNITKIEKINTATKLKLKVFKSTYPIAFASKTSPVEEIKPKTTGLMPVKKA